MGDPKQNAVICTKAMLFVASKEAKLVTELVPFLDQMEREDLPMFCNIT